MFLVLHFAIGASCEERVVTGNEELTAPLVLGDNCVLTLASGAVLSGPSNASGWPQAAPLPSYPGVARYAPLVTLQGSNVTVRGGGKLDGRGGVWWDEKEESHVERPRLLSLEKCVSCQVLGVTLTNSPFWTLHIYRSLHVLVSRITIDNPIHSPNTDGVDPDSSSNVLIDNISVSTGDDCISVKSGLLVGSGWPCTNVTVSNSEFHHCAGLAIGSETAGGIDGVFFLNNSMKLTSGAIRVKAQYLQGATITNITYDALKLDGVGRAIYFDPDYESKPGGGNGTSSHSTWGSITMSNVAGVAALAAEMECDTSTMPCLNLHLINIDIDSVVGWRCKDAVAVNGTTSGYIHPKPCWE